MTDSFTFVSVAFGDQRYLDQLKRLKASIYAVYGTGYDITWKDTLPMHSKPFLQSLYGFKVHAVDWARHLGYTKIVWLDPACIVQDKLDYYFSLLHHYGVIAVEDDNYLPGYCSDREYKYFGVDIEYSRTMRHKLVGGSFYVFDFENALCNKIFETWKKAEYDGLFGTQHEQATEQMNRSRSDESCMALSLYTHGSKPLPTTLAMYCCENAIIDKKHFK